MGKTTIYDQRYISDELCHFVGRKKEEDEQYDLLVNKILKTGWITYGPDHDPTKPHNVSIDLSKPISTDEAILSQVVCFCDIPVSDLAIHTNKYSKFGLAFKKSFLVDKGACPVFYVVNECNMKGVTIFNPIDFRERIDHSITKGVCDRALYFDTSYKAVMDILIAFDMFSCEESKRYIKVTNESDFSSRMRQLFGLTESQISTIETSLKGNEQSILTIRMLIDFLINHIFTYFKCFDSKLSADDENNYYMEREWRVNGNVNFDLTDVSRIFFPQKYAKKFREDLPEYLGQITFLNCKEEEGVILERGQNKTK